jgi:hypothetical protein
MIQQSPNGQGNFSRNIVISSHHQQQMLQVLNDNNNGTGEQQVIKFELVSQEQHPSSVK